MESFGVAGGIFAVSLVIAILVRSKILKVRERLPQEKQAVVSLLASSSYVGILVVGLITALSKLGINVTALIAGLGLTGFALGFALKDIISNLLAGILIILLTPFRVGDRIRVGSNEGKVIEINLRYTVLESKEERILIPNSTMFTNIIAVKGE